MAHVSNKRHIRSISAPKTWPISRKEKYWIIRPRTVGYKFEYSMPILLWIRDYLKLVRTRREAVYALKNGKILVNNKVIRDPAYSVGLFDVISIPDLNKNYRVVFSNNLKLKLIEIQEQEKDLKIIRIVRKNLVKGGKIQVTGLDGSNFLFDNNEINTGDSILYNTKENKIEKILKMKEGNIIYIYYGAKVGRVGRLKSIKIMKKTFGNNRFIEYLNIDTNKVEETIWEYSIVIGEDKPLITVR
ncbi:MAG: 30S ribosomal protein S4e [Nanopusillaceae archaeon]